MTGRRLPVYLVLDTSGSMVGDKIEAVRQGVKLLLSELRSDPMAMETAYLSVITFSSTAQQMVPLSDALTFQEPTLDASGSTAMGSALEELMKCVDRDIVKNTAETKGDYKPLVFLITDGQPTDNWEQAADKLKNKHWNIIACAAGADADEQPLKRFANVVLKIQDATPGALKQYFKLVTQSIKTQSASVQQVAADAPVTLPPQPGIIVVP